MDQRPADLPPIVPPASWRERFVALRHDPRTGTVMLCLLGIAIGVLWFQFGQSNGAANASGSSATNGGRARATASPPKNPNGTAAGSSVPVARTLVVQVAGAVVRPGVVELPDGARVADALKAAGGPTPDAAPDRLNLAAKVADGERLDVPRVGDPVAPPTAVGSQPGGRSGAGSSTPASPSGAGPVNLNTATKEQLDGLPGIGPSLADAIIAEREKRGGFRSVDDLASVRGIGAKRLADLRRLVTV